MLKAESYIALGLMGLAAYFMWHATVLPIGWAEGSGPGEEPSHSGSRRS